MKTDSSAKYLNWKNNMEIPSDTDILINATSIGFSPNVTDKPDIDYTAITPGMCVCDVIFNPAETIFLKSAAENGAKLSPVLNAGTAGRTEFHPLDRRGSAGRCDGGCAEEGV